MEIIANSYFSGCGVFDYGFASEGITIQQSFELDHKACETQRLNFNHNVVECDITKKLVLTDDESHVMLVTFPCTKYSNIADINNARTGDDLFLHAFRHLALQRPDVFVIENVPGMKKFPVVMEAMTTLPDYYVYQFCPVNANIWLPQERERLIIIGSKKPFDWRYPTNAKKIPLRQILEKDPDVDSIWTKSIDQRMNGFYRDLPIISDPDEDDNAPCCLAHYHKDRSTRLVKDAKHKYGVRPYTPREWARLMGLPDSFKFYGTNNDIYKMVGNGVPVPIGQWVAREIKRYFAKFSDLLNKPMRTLNHYVKPTQQLFAF